VLDSIPDGNIPEPGLFEAIPAIVRQIFLRSCHRCSFASPFLRCPASSQKRWNSSKELISSHDNHNHVVFCASARYTALQRFAAVDGMELRSMKENGAMTATLTFL
jgi:hypothetical protein